MSHVAHMSESCCTYVTRMNVIRFGTQDAGPNQLIYSTISERYQLIIKDTLIPF